MEFGRATIFLIILCFRSTLCQDETINMKEGTSVVLKPGTTVGAIRNILWKKGDNIAMEYTSPDPVIPYREFKERGFLDIKNGAMNITGLTHGDSGLYTVDINNLVNKKIRLNVFAPVGKPNVSASCDYDHCNLTCVGSATAEAQPVSFIWIINNQQTPIKTKEYTITKDDKVESIRCELENPVSSQQSDEIPNPLVSAISAASSTGKIVGGIFGAILILLLLCLILFILHITGIIELPVNRIFTPQQPVAVNVDQPSNPNQGQNGANVRLLTIEPPDPNRTAAGNDDVIPNGPQAEGVERPGPSAEPTENPDGNGEAPTTSDDHGNADASKPTDKPDDGEPAPDKKPQENGVEDTEG